MRLRRDCSRWEKLGAVFSSVTSPPSDLVWIRSLALIILPYIKIQMTGKEQPE